MLRLFDIFGRSSALRAVDDALRAAGVHPLLVPDAVKLTVNKLHSTFGRAGNQDGALPQSAQLLAYCILGHEQFAASNSDEAADRIDHRVETALDEGDTLDAKLILLALHAGLMAPEIVDRIDLEDT